MLRHSGPFVDIVNRVLGFLRSQFGIRNELGSHLSRCACVACDHFYMWSSCIGGHGKGGCRFYQENEAFTAIGGRAIVYYSIMFSTASTEWICRTVCQNFFVFFFLHPSNECFNELVVLVACWRKLRSTSSVNTLRVGMARFVLYVLHISSWNQVLYIRHNLL